MLEADQWTAEAGRDAASVNEADSKLKRATLRLESEIGGVDTKVASVEAQLMQARYYLDNTALVAPEDGRIINLQVRPGMVSGVYRTGGIAAFVVDSGRYVLATYFQENLKYVRGGQPVEIALDPYPGQIFKGRVGQIWRANAAGQYLPSDVLPGFDAADSHQAVGQFPSRSISMTQIRRSFRLARMAWGRSIPAAEGSRRCARFPSARMLGLIGSNHSELGPALGRVTTD